MKLYALASAAIVVVLAVVLRFSWVPISSSSCSPPPSFSAPVADLVVKNAVIFTSDESLPFADSTAVRNGRILRVGNHSFVQEVAGYGTVELNLEGKVVVPGFIDSHVHLLFGGLQIVRVELRGVNQKDEFIRKVKEAVRNAQEGSWILGGGWNNNLWGGELPVASWIDDITPYNPVWLSRMDGHMGLANSVALKLSGIGNLQENPEGGTIMRTSSGEPTGLLIDSAMKLLLPWIPKDSVNRRREALHRASNLALMRGVTTVVDFGRYFPGASAELSWEDFSDVYQWADISGKMMIRVCLFFPMETWPRLLDLTGKMGRALSQWIYLGGVKAFADGSLGSNSALFYEPYVDDPQNYGLEVTEIKSLSNMTLSSDKSGLQVAIHAIGDRANDLILDMYDSVVSTNGMRDRRFRIEHAQHLAPGAAARFGRQGIIASVQPEHLLYDADSAAKKLGTDRAQKGSYLFRSLLASNAQLAFGSDWPVADINPLGGIRTAMKRIPPAWNDAWIPSECLTLDDALKGQFVLFSSSFNSLVHHHLSHSIEILPYVPVTQFPHLCMLPSITCDQGCEHRRNLQNRETDLAGLVHLVKFYKSRRFDANIGLPKPNDFHDFPEYFVLEAIPHAVAMVRAADKKSPREAVEFVLQLLKYNDNNGNPYSDVFWLAELVQSVGELEFGQQSILFLTSLLKRIDRLLQFDRLMPSHNGILTVSCIRTLTQIALKLSEFIPHDRVFELIRPFRDFKTIWKVRIEASRALLDLEFHSKGIGAALSLFIKYLEEEPSLRGQVKLAVHAMRLCQISSGSDSIDTLKSDMLVSLLRLLDGHIAFNNVFLRHHLFCIIQILAGRPPTLYGVPRETRTLLMGDAEACIEQKNIFSALVSEVKPPDLPSDIPHPPEPPSNVPDPLELPPDMPNPSHDVVGCSAWFQGRRYCF
ncbi:Transcription initiation factor TFIID subunit 2 [Morella rubra]|uniref:Transcription initiation factor TFIID subunit 2 n=1 Tax=Morella rubra TaxID=262757 RepID=A0A6A1UQ45_9ROSI|nr:Transcription initiation factor TFIID subunit 2 [Morella rubra]